MVKYRISTEIFAYEFEIAFSFFFSEGQCTIELTDENGKFHQLTEGEIIPIKRKWYKVEDCRLNRAYMAACGSHLFYQMLDVVCSYVDDHPHAKRSLQRRQTNDDLISVLDQSFYGVCCQSACTIPELARHCTPKW